MGLKGRSGLNFALWRGWGGCVRGDGWEVGSHDQGVVQMLKVMKKSILSS